MITCSNTVIYENLDLEFCVLRSATDARGRWLRSARGPAWRVLGELPQEKMPRRARGESGSGGTLPAA